jgi:hypothetical protein
LNALSVLIISLKLLAAIKIFSAANIVVFTAGYRMTQLVNLLSLLLYKIYEPLLLLFIILLLRHYNVSPKQPDSRKIDKKFASSSSLALFFVS